MSAALAHSHIVERPRLRDFAWLLPTIMLLALVTGAVAGLVNGFPPVDVIGADGADSLAWGVP